MIDGYIPDGAGNTLPYWDIFHKKGKETHL